MLQSGCSESIGWTKGGGHVKKKVLISAVILALLVGGLFFVTDRVSPETYSTARQSSEEFLRRNEDELESIALGLLVVCVDGL